MAHQLKTKLPVAILLLCAIFIGLSCSTETEPVYTLEVELEAEEAQGGSVEQSSSEASKGEKITLTAVPEEHYRFVQWGGDYTGTENPLEIVMEDDMVIYPIFEKIEYPITIEIEGEGTVEEEVIQEKTLDLTHETTLKLTAKPETGWEFVEWGGDVSGEENEIELTVEGEMNITAVFEKIDYEVTVNIEGEGSVDREVIQGKTSEEHPFGTVLRLTAKPESGWEFVEWSGDASGNESVTEIAVNQEKEITATFKKSEFTVSIGSVSGNGNILQEVIQSKTANNEYTSGTVLRVTAVPDQGWEFSNWTGDLQGKKKVEEITVQDEMEIGAVFKKLPSVETNAVSEITKDEAKVGGKVNSRSNVDVLDKGICWSTDPNIDPNLNEDYECKSSNPGDGSFERTIGNLSPTTEYFVVAYAAININGEDFVLGNRRSFTTKSAIELASITTTSISSVTSNSATSGGNVTNNGGAKVTERGLCWKNSPEPLYDTDGTVCVAQGSGVGSFTTQMTGLVSGNSYWVKAYAINEAGISYGKQESFTTDKGSSDNDGGSDDGGSDDGGSDDGGESNFTPPSLTTKSISSVTSNSATSGGNVTNNGGAKVTERGLCWKNSPEPLYDTDGTVCVAQGSGVGSFTTQMTGLVSGNSYWVKAYAINEAGISYGKQESFTTDKGSSDDGGGSDDGGESDDGGDPAPPPSGGDTTTMLIMFSSSSLANSGTSTGALDVNVNGTWYNFSSRFTPVNSLSVIGKGVVINVNGPVERVQLRQSQIRKKGLNNDCYGFTTLKLLQKHPDFDPYKVNKDRNSVNYWASSYNRKGRLVERGSKNYLVDVDDPNFYSQNTSSYNESGKFMLWVDGVGTNHGGYKVNDNPLLDPPRPGLYPTGRTNALKACTDM